MEKVRSRTGVAALAAALLATAVLVARAGTAPAAESPSAGGYTARVPVRESLEVVGPVLLEFDGLAGSLSVQPGAPGKLEITAFKTADGTSPEDAATRAAALPLAIRRENDRVSFSARSRGLFPWSPRPPLRVDYQIVAPEESGLKVVDGSGTVLASGLHRGVDVAGDGLAVRLTNVGAASVAVRQGNVVVDGAAGAVRLRTEAGDIQAQHISGPGAELDAAGTVYVAESEVAGDLSVVSGGKLVSMLRTGGRAIAVKARQGRIELTDTTAEEGLRLEAGAGGVSIERAQAHPLAVSTERGGAELNEVQGDVAVRTAGGGVWLSGASPASLAVSSGGGDVYFSGSLPAAGPTTVDTGGGQLRLTIARESAFDLDADSGQGRLAVAEALLPGRDLSGGKASAPINGGGPKAALRTHGGQLTVSVR